MSYVWTPPPELVEQSNLTAFLRATGQSDYDALAARADADPAWLMQEVFRFCDVRFSLPYRQMLDLSRGQPWARWCLGGTTNIVLNCIDKHRNTPVWNQTFLVWEGEDRHERRTLSYREFSRESIAWPAHCARSASRRATSLRSTCRICRRPSQHSSQS